jgi:hypothetical protein
LNELSGCSSSTFGLVFFFGSRQYSYEMQCWMNYSHPGQDWQPVWQGNRGVGRQTLEIQKENPGAPDSAMLHGRKPSILKPMVNEYYASRMDKIGENGLRKATG